MSEEKPRPRILDADIEKLAALVEEYYEGEIDAQAKHLANLERALGRTVTTADLRAFYRKHRGCCPECGKRIIGG